MYRPWLQIWGTACSGVQLSLSFPHEAGLQDYGCHTCKQALCSNWPGRGYRCSHANLACIILQMQEICVARARSYMRCHPLYMAVVALAREAGRRVLVVPAQRALVLRG